MPPAAYPATDTPRKELAPLPLACAAALTRACRPSPLVISLPYPLAGYERPCCFDFASTRLLCVAHISAMCIILLSIVPQAVLSAATEASSLHAFLETFPNPHLIAMKCRRCYSTASRCPSGIAHRQLVLQRQRRDQQGRLSGAAQRCCR